MRVVIAVLAATLVLGPPFAVGFFLLGQVLVFDVADRLLSWLVRLILDAPPARSRGGLSISSLKASDLWIMVQFAYVVGALPAILGGSFLGWRFTRTPPKLGGWAPLFVGAVLGGFVACVLAASGGGPLRAQASLAVITVCVSAATAVACWAVCRTLYGAMRPRIA